jgi:hypothetical protein
MGWLPSTSEMCEVSLVFARPASIGARRDPAGTRGSGFRARLRQGDSALALTLDGRQQHYEGQQPDHCPQRPLGRLAAYAPNREQLIKRRIRDSELARHRIGEPERVAYGSAEIERLDIGVILTISVAIFV